jgi:tetratricopeptide (TPR) repeat protein
MMRKALLLLGAVAYLGLAGLGQAQVTGESNLPQNALLEHPLAAVTLFNQAEQLRKQGLFVEAERDYQRAIRIWENFFGKEHPAVTAGLSGLGDLYQQQGKLAEAEKLHQRALRIREQYLGKEHPGTGFSVRSMALLREQQGRLIEAEALCQRAARIFVTHLPDGHPDIAATQAQCTRLQGRIHKR